MRKILFLGTHGQKNWGDELLLHVFMNRLLGVADRFYVNSYDPALTTAYLDRPDVTVFNTRTDRFKLLSYLISCDAIVFGGGNILKELYTEYGGSRYATLGMIDGLTRVARLLGKPIYLCNIGIGPVESERGRDMVTRIVQRARLTTVRDSESRMVLASLPITTPYALTSDAVWATNRAYFNLPSLRPKRQIKNAGDARTIGINLCRNISNNSNWSYFLQQLANDVTRLHHQNPRLRFVGIPMQFDVASNNDSAALQQLTDMIHAAAPGVHFEIAAPKSLKALAATIESLDVMLAERLHALILSLIVGVPVVALEYDVKVSGLVKDLGLHGQGIDINAAFQPGSFFDAVTGICTNYKQAEATVAEIYEANHERSTASFANLNAALTPEAETPEPQFIEEQS